VKSEQIVDPDRHVDGSIDVAVPEDCSACHGDASPAPPPDVSGNLTSAAPGVGAHRAHVAPSGAVRAVGCSECHAVPPDVLSPGHLDSLLPAEVVFSGVATAFQASPSYDAGTCTATFCHGGSFIGGRPSGGSETEPSWVVSQSNAPLACSSCHGMPPPPPHPADAACATCHLNVDANQSFSAPETHVDGNVTFFLP
jgi:predicted CxxxxCH...CXXCH cytochrome family protein